MEKRKIAILDISEKESADVITEAESFIQDNLLKGLFPVLVIPEGKPATHLPFSLYMMFVKGQTGIVNKSAGKDATASVKSRYLSAEIVSGEDKTGNEPPEENTPLEDVISLHKHTKLQDAAPVSAESPTEERTITKVRISREPKSARPAYASPPDCQHRVTVRLEEPEIKSISIRKIYRDASSNK